MNELWRFNPRFDLREASYWASRFQEDPLEHQIISEIAPRAREQGYLTKVDFLLLAKWKSPRPLPRYAANSEDYVREVTRVALSTPSEQLRIRVLTLLDGVDWPVASVILHFAHDDPYPILDRRALWSLGYDRPPAYNFAFWERYTAYTRVQAERYGLTMRELDRALWHFSKEHEGIGPDSVHGNSSDS